MSTQRPSVAAAWPPALAELKARLVEISDLASAARLLQWDQATYMPPAGAPARARQKARLQAIAHERAVDPAIGRLLDALEPVAATADPDDDDARLVVLTRRDYERAVRVPTDYVRRSAEAASASYQAWTSARPANDFAAMRPHLEVRLALACEYAGFFPGHAHVMDPLIGPDEGLTVAETRALFDALRARLVPLVEAICAAPAADDGCLRRHYPEAAQLDFALRMAERFGYDLARGRLDKTAHPFMTGFSRDDIRITTRVREDDLSDALFSTWHETGHALYEQGIGHNLVPPLGRAVSPGVHESQSRLWENIVARSRGFWQHAYPGLQEKFPVQLGGVPLDVFYRAINKVSRTLIRTDADEVTYNLHVLIRFDLECEMLEGRLAIADLADAWNARYRSDLGIEAFDHRDGVLQDVHWYAGGLGGAFQGYTIGNILAAQFHAAAIAAHPSIEDEIVRGEFGSLRSWLRTNIYSHGRRYDVAELVERVTGGPMSIEPYMRYLEAKYTDLYGIAVH